jgi:hypothetical protein
MSGRHGEQATHIRCIRADKASENVTLLRCWGEFFTLGVRWPKIRVGRDFAKANMFSVELFVSRSAFPYCALR